MSRLYPNMHTILNAGVIELLNSKQICTVVDFIRADNRLLEKAANLTFREILDVKNSLIKTYSARPKNGFEYYKHILINSAIIETGIKKVDILLEGGLFTANIYEICGLPAAGKTLFSLTLMKHVICNMKENIFYLDTKNDFCARKLKQMLNMDSKEELVEAMNKALIQKISTKSDLIHGLLEIIEKLRQGFKLRVIIIDSLPAIYLQSPNHTENNSFLNYMVNILRYLTVEYNVVVLVTNLITLWNEGSFSTQDAFKEKISCGKCWYNVPNARLKIERGSTENKCKITLMKTMKIMPEFRECEVELTDFGIK